MSALKYLNPNKLFVNFREGVTLTDPVTPRRYTLTHSDETADLYLSIGQNYAYNELNPSRDEVLAEWVRLDGQHFILVNVLVDGQFGAQEALIRNQMFRRELPLALEAIRYGDRVFFEFNAPLDNSDIFVKFNSSIPELNKVEYWGKASDYR